MAPKKARAFTAPVVLGACVVSVVLVEASRGGDVAPVEHADVPFTHCIHVQYTTMVLDQMPQV
jgi:hypothetical protein